ncbi:unnamed protein product [Trichogramma brassicae]|uniref:Uncharacterized protein n=2 Tax=Trichogramma brassicae TaxID=86971 RepID=A0A6H5J1D0_9HYME|nr:unnamed protein product [Trichogramma brassicae]
MDSNVPAQDDKTGKRQRSVSLKDSSSQSSQIDRSGAKRRNSSKNVPLTISTDREFNALPSRRGAVEIHSRAAEQGRGGARRQALLPDHMPGEEVPSARQQFEGGDRADAFQGARIPDGRARPARHVLRSDRLVDYVYYPLEPAEYWWQLEEQLSQELDGIDVIFGNLLAPLSSCASCVI